MGTACARRWKRRCLGAEFAVVGSRGQLGQEFLRVLGRRAVGLERRQLDVADAEACARVLGELGPRVVINCAAFNQVDWAETRHAAALAANAEGPGHLAALAAARGFRLVHFSTDYVFGGDGLTRPRTENDAPAPVNFYGYSKLLGEEAVLRTCPSALVLRVAHLYGGRSRSPGRASLVERFVERARAGEAIAVTRGQWLNPTSVRDIVAATLRLLPMGAHGLFHLTGEGACEADTFAREVCRRAGLRPKLRYVTHDERPARRAAHTVLANARWAALGLGPLPDWRTSLAGGDAAR
ncbi:MAG: NAD(P)-dependent oxidoreductase [Acidobacteria bacterium]|nr:MAG: NAD(P)-dependent oxidoreductase [Acidobacteriota bacterium]